MKKLVTVLAVVVTMLALATSGAAAAVVTWHDSWGISSNKAYSSLVASDSGAIVWAPEASNIGSDTLTNGTASATFTNTSSGFSISGSGGSADYLEAIRYFTISGLTGSETLTGTFDFSLPNVVLGGGIVKWNPDLYGGVWDSSSYFTSVPATVQLSNGTYHVSMSAGADPTVAPSGSIPSLGNGGTFATFTIPEPATMLLLGLGGLLLRKRRV